MVEKLKNYQATAQYFFKKWNVRKLEQTNEILKESFKNFSIGSVMQMVPLAFEGEKDANSTVE